MMIRTLLDKHLRRIHGLLEVRARDEQTFGSGSTDALHVHGRAKFTQGRFSVENSQAEVAEFGRGGGDSASNCLVKFYLHGSLQQGSGAEWTVVDGRNSTPSISGSAMWFGLVAKDAMAMGDQRAMGGMDESQNRFFEFKGPNNNSEVGRGLFVREDNQYLRLRAASIERVGGNVLNIESEQQIRSETIADDTTGNAENMVVDSSGGRIRRSTSASRFKRDIEPADLSLSRDIIGKAEPIWYRSKCDGDNPDWSFWGFTAEAVAEIDPRLVQWGYERGDYEQVQTGEKRLKEGAELKPQGVAYSRYVVHLVNVVQDQETRIKTLEERLAKLEAQLG